MSRYVVILAGGAGARFWPAGRRARPKQLLPIASEKTMLSETLERCAGLAPPERIFIVTNTEQVEATRAECATLPDVNVLAEPMMRNTAAAIGLAAALLAQRDPEAVMMVMPADHVIRPVEVFEATFDAAATRAAEAGTLITIGIQPAGPATGYGYIEGGDVVAEVTGHPVHRVISFKEKPDSATAEKFLATGRYFWNSGTFVWRASTLMDALEAHLPGHHHLLVPMGERLARGEAITAEDYERFENVPIDIGVMERADNVEVIPGTFEWDDVGSWLAVDRLSEKDEQGNVTRGAAVTIDTDSCIVIGRPDHVIATVGLSDMIVVHTPDATLVCPKERAEEVRRIVQQLGADGLEEYL